MSLRKTFNQLWASAWWTYSQLGGGSRGGKGPEHKKYRTFIRKRKAPVIRSRRCSPLRQTTRISSCRWKRSHGPLRIYVLFIYKIYNVFLLVFCKTQVILFWWLHDRKLHIKSDDDKENISVFKHIANCLLSTTCRSGPINVWIFIIILRLSLILSLVH